MEIILPEIASLGVYNSQIALKNKTVTGDRTTTMFEIEIPIEKGGISYIDSDKIPIEPNMVICAKPGQIRHSKLPLKCYYMHIIIRGGALHDALMDVPNYIKTNKMPQYYEMFKRLCKYYGTDFENDGIILQSIILEIIYTLINDSKKLVFQNNVKSSHYDVIKAVKKHIKENLSANLSLDAVADYAGFSPIHFHNCFKSATGKTLHEYVEEQRIKKAANMLVTTDNTLTEIAYECGFSSQSYFSYAFKRKMKLTPREYAKEIFNRYETEA